MKYILIAIFATSLWVVPASAVTPAEDIASTILLRGYDCGGKQVSQIDEQQDGRGNKTIRATCPNGVRYQIDVSTDGRVSVKPLR